MRSWIIVSAVLITLAVLTPAFGDESATNPEDIVKSGWNETLQLMNEALPQMIFIVVLLLNLCASLIPDGHPKSPTCGHLKIPHLPIDKLSKS
jgi:hypothetical protein